MQVSESVVVSAGAAIDGVVRTETSLAMGELIPYRLGPLLDRPS